MRSLVCLAVLSLAACHRSAPADSTTPVDDNAHTTSAEAPAPAQAAPPTTVVVTAPAPQVSIYVNAQPSDQGGARQGAAPNNTPQAPATTASMTPNSAQPTPAQSPAPIDYGYPTTAPVPVTPQQRGAPVVNAPPPQNRTSEGTYQSAPAPAPTYNGGGDGYTGVGGGAGFTGIGAGPGFTGVGAGGVGLDVDGGS